MDPTTDAARVRNANAVPDRSHRLTLIATTALPWLASMLLTDIFAGLSVLSLFIIVAQGNKTSAAEKWLLFAFTAFAAATHSATLGVLLRPLLRGWMVRPWVDARIPRVRASPRKLDHCRWCRNAAVRQFRSVRTICMDSRRLRSCLRSDDAGRPCRALPEWSLPGSSE